MPELRVTMNLKYLMELSQGRITTSESYPGTLASLLINNSSLSFQKTHTARSQLNHCITLLTS